MSLVTVPEVAELKLIEQKVAYVTYYKKDENIISSYNCLIVILVEANPGYVKGKCQ